MGSSIRVKWWGEANDGRILKCVAPNTRHMNCECSSSSVMASFRPPEATQGSVDNCASYDINCSPDQLTKYLNDMRVLVIEVLDHPYDVQRPINVVGHAYLHLPMLKFDQRCEMDLSVYDELSQEIAKLVVSVHIDFSTSARLIGRRHADAFAVGHGGFQEGRRHGVGVSMSGVETSMVDGHAVMGALQTPVWVNESVDLGSRLQMRRSATASRAQTGDR